ncbi:MAG: methyltransferase [Prevotella sp.]|nr:methyltransferase [Prevotellaceae bacterium]MDY3936437.1 methyltransferase [Prevotella sp.]
MGFTFKQFHIEQDQCAMKVGTDGVLLGAWAEGGKRILDIGTGTGLIALMMAQRYPEAVINGIEIEENAAHQALSNANNSPFKAQIKIFHTSLQNHTATLACEKMPTLYDAIVSNPPFFVASLKNHKSNKTMARHTDTLPFSDLMKCSHFLLQPEGTLSIIIPTDQLKMIETEASIYGFFISQMVHIKTKNNKPSKRLLMQFKKHPSPIIQQEVSLINASNERSEWYTELTKDFYIK